MGTCSRELKTYGGGRAGIEPGRKRKGEKLGDIYNTINNKIYFKMKKVKNLDLCRIYNKDKIQLRCIIEDKRLFYDMTIK